MKKINDFQIAAMQEMIKSNNYQRARELRDNANIGGDTYTTDPQIAELMVQAYYACIDPNHKGKKGIKGEAEQRLDLRCCWKRFQWRWADCWKKADGQDDSIFYVENRRYTCESKTGCGDWQKVRTNSLPDALAEMSNHPAKDFIRWHNADFDIVLPWTEFYSALAEYNTKKGAATWFNSQIRPAPSGGWFIVRNQPVSPKKLRFLVELEERSYNWGEIQFNRRLIRNCDLMDEE